MSSALHRALMAHQAAPIVDQAMSNYCAMSPEQRKVFAADVAKFHRDTFSENPFQQDQSK